MKKAIDSENNFSNQIPEWTRVNHSLTRISGI
jgi:hypothetical protein